MTTDVHGFAQQVTDNIPDFGFAITPDDNNDLDHVTTCIYVGGAGNLSVRDAQGNSVTFNSVPAGTTIRFRAYGVNSTGTTATALVGLY